MTKAVHITPNCLNCGKPIHAQRYCGACGQEHLVELYSLKELAGHYAEDFLSLDSRLLRSLWPLLIRPGFLTQEYRAGRRNQYIRPLRLYLLSSILFFSIFLLRYDLSDAIQMQDNRSGASIDDEDIQALIDGEKDVDDLVDALTDSTTNAESDSEVNISLFRIPGLTRVNQWMEEREKHLREMSVQEVVRLIIDGSVRHAPKAIFFLVPAVAWALKLLYVRRMRYYMEHFIFALHWHSFLFILFTIAMFIPWGWLRAILLLSSPIYLLLALRSYYAQDWWRTVLKHQLIMNAYIVFLPLVATALGLIAALTA